MSANNVENQIIDGTNSEQIVIQTQPKTDKTQEKPKMTSTEELAFLGLRPNSENPDPCVCIGCVFCVELCFTGRGSVPPIPQRKGTEMMSLGNNDINEGDSDDDNNEGMEWVLAVGALITCNLSDGDSDDSDNDNDSGGYVESDGGNFWDGLGGGGGDGGGD